MLMISVVMWELIDVICCRLCSANKFFNPFRRRISKHAVAHRATPIRGLGQRHQILGVPQNFEYPQILGVRRACKNVAEFLKILEDKAV